MNKIQTLLDVLSKIYQILLLVYNSKCHGSLVFEEEPQMNRQEVKDYLGSASVLTSRRLEKDVRPLKLPGGDKYKSELLSEFKESRRRAWLLSIYLFSFFW